MRFLTMLSREITGTLKIKMKENLKCFGIAMVVVAMFWAIMVVALSI